MTIKTFRIPRLVFFLICFVLAVSCQAENADSDETSTISESESIISIAMEDLSQRTGDTVSDIELVSIEKSDPETPVGTSTEQRETSDPTIDYKYVVILQISDQLYKYQINQNEEIELVQTADATAETTTTNIPTITDGTIPIIPGEIMDGKPWMPVD